MRYLVLVTALALSACTVGLGGKAGKAVTANPITGGEVSVTPLSGPPGAAKPGAAATPAAKPPLPNPARPHPAETAKPGAKPEAPAAKPAETTEAAAEEPKPEPPPASPEEVACRKKGGQWAKVGKGAGQTCVQRTRDAGKECTKASQCEGLCLARSGTCAPIAPLFGCNEILQNDGSRVTLCID
jgi:hypothetical protein